MDGAGKYYPKGEMMIKGVECIRYFFSSWPQEEPSSINNQPKGEPAKRMRDWSMLPRDISNLIMEKIIFPPVLHKFASSCKEWCSVTQETLNFVHTQEPLLMLPYDENTKLLTLVRLKNFQIYNLKMPELHNRWICGVSNGCLATTDESPNVVLFDIFKRTQLSLPVLDKTVLLNLRGDERVRSDIRYKVLKVALSENPSCSNCLVAIITDIAFSIAVSGLGNDKWTMVDGPNKSGSKQFRDIIFYQGKICAVNTEQLVIIDYHDSCNFSSEKIPIPKENLHENDDSVPWKYLYLAVLSDQLLLVERYTKQNYERPLRTHKFKVFRFENNTKSWSRIYTLGDQSLFIGANKTVSKSTKELPWCKPNCIYFLDNSHDNYFVFGYGYECDNGLFSLDDGHIENLDIDHSTFVWEAPAIWCM